MRESNKLSNENLNGSKKKTNDNSVIEQNNINSLLEDGKKIISNDNDSSYGPLTQRLISALIEQNLMTPFDTDMTDLEVLGDPKGQYMSPRTLAKQLNIATSQSLEKKIKKELIEQGILDEEDLTDSQDESEEKIDKDDEIAIEIKRLQSELESVSSTCKMTQKQLLNVAKEVMQQQEIKKKIDLIDNEIKELFQKSKSLKINKKSLPKKDRERAQKLINDREQLKHDLNEFLIPTLNL
jgi:transcriptional adapter 3